MILIYGAVLIRTEFDSKYIYRTRQLLEKCVQNESRKKIPRKKGPRKNDSRKTDPWKIVELISEFFNYTSC